jgi:thiamine-monophosphate kinase
MAEQAEFVLIKKYFTPGDGRKDVRLGVGDDCALLVPPTGKQLAVTVDTLVSGVHFLVETSPSDIAYKSIAVSLSDLAAMGAEPAWVTLALTLPDISNDWLQAFSESFSKTLSDYGMQLIGGDTTQGPLSITVQATGFIDPDHAMQRNNAQSGDLVYVTGTLGDASIGLELLTKQVSVDQKIFDQCVGKLNHPVPRVEFARAAAQYCSCAIDVSDGLIADLGHILSSSHCGAEIHLDRVPLSKELREYFIDSTSKDRGINWARVLGGGDDYELCMTISDDKADSLIALAESMNLELTCIGRVDAGNDLRVLDSEGQQYVLDKTGYGHFADND